MSDRLISVITLIVLVTITALLIGTLISHVQRERRSSNVRRVWANFGLSIAFCVLFLVSWISQGIAEWGAYRAEQLAHGEPVDAASFIVVFGQSTLENWQSEFLQLFAFVLFSALLIHRNSAESKDGTERIEKKIDALSERIDELEGVRTGR